MMKCLFPHVCPTPTSKFSAVLSASATTSYCRQELYLRIRKKLVILPVIYKKGDKKDPGNYRPISQMAVACKVLETFIRYNIVDHMIRNNLFSDHQHGFINLMGDPALHTCWHAWTLGLGPFLFICYIKVKTTYLMTYS